MFKAHISVMLAGVTNLKIERLTEAARSISAASSPCLAVSRRARISSGRRFDFGRSTPHEGTYQFKQQWGAAPQQLYWEYWLGDGCQLPDRGPKNPKFSAAIAVWQKLPVAVTRVVGPHIVRNIP